MRVLQFQHPYKKHKSIHSGGAPSSKGWQQYAGKGAPSKSPLASLPTPGSAADVACDGSMRGWILAALLEAMDAAREAAGGVLDEEASYLETVRTNVFPTLLCRCSALAAPALPPLLSCA